MMTMLQTVWQKISGKPSKTDATPAISTSQMPSLVEQNITPFFSFNKSPESVSDKYFSLWKLQSQRQIIEVKLANSNVSHQTMIMAIDTQRGIIWLDDLFPNQRTLEIGDQLTVRHHRNGDQLTFTSPIVAWGGSYGANGLAIMLPEKANYLPRRKSERCDLAKKASIPVKIRPIGHEESYGALQDLSLGGLRLSIVGNLLSQLTHGAFLPVCELTLSDELHICCSARVRAFRIERNVHRCTHISLEFVDMPFEKQLQLRQFLNNLQHYQHADALEPSQQDLIKQSA